MSRSTIKSVEPTFESFSISSMHNKQEKKGSFIEIINSVSSSPQLKLSLISTTYRIQSRIGCALV